MTVPHYSRCVIDYLLCYKSAILSVHNTPEKNIYIQRIGELIIRIGKYKVVQNSVKKKYKSSITMNLKCIQTNNFILKHAKMQNVCIIGIGRWLASTIIYFEKLYRSRNKWTLTANLAVNVNLCGQFSNGGLIKNLSITQANI